MRERVEMLGGTLQRNTESGTTLTITLPLKMANAEGSAN
jgi:signal transduction histidine kinase